jgi:hypothetical protein
VVALSGRRIGWTPLPDSSAHPPLPPSQTLLCAVLLAGSMTPSQSSSSKTPVDQSVSEEKSASYGAIVESEPDEWDGPKNRC